MRLYLYLLTPFLGFLRNYVKYKQVKLNTFLRTPLTYGMFHLLFRMLNQSNVVWKTLIVERWFFFVKKTIQSIVNRDYYRKRDKYKAKYNLVYSDSDSESRA